MARWTAACASGSRPYDEVRSTAAYANLPQGSWDWAKMFVRQGGASLAAYPDYRRAGSAGARGMQR